MKKRVLILGASRYYVRSIIAAKELGCEVIVVDRNPKAEGFRYADYHEAADFSDIDRSLNVATKYHIDGVVAVNDFGVKPAAVIAKEMGLVSISPQIAEYATSKALMRSIWKNAGVPSPRFKVVRTLDESRAALSYLGTFPLILKPSDSRGGGSRGVSKIDSEKQLEKAFIYAQSYYDDKKVVIEEYLDGIEHSVETITYNGDTYVLAVSDKVKTPPPYRVDKSIIYPTVFSGRKLQKIHDVVKAAVKAIGINVGAAHVELCSTNEGPKLFELGARCGGGGTPDPIVPFLTGIEMFKEVVRIALGEKPNNLKPLFQKACVYRFITPKVGIVKKVVGLDEVKSWEKVLDCDVLVSQGDSIREVKSGGDRTGFLIAGGGTRDEAIDLADRAEKHIYFEYLD